jgi:hypothetical protein
MTSKVLGYGMVGLLTVALLGGVGYILLNPTEGAGQGPVGEQGHGRGRSEIWQGEAGTADDVAGYAKDQQAQGRGWGGSETAQNVGGPANGVAAYGQRQSDQRQGALGGAGASDGNGRSSGVSQGRSETVLTVEWETLTGTVIAIDGEVTIQTAEGEVLVGMGQSAYWQSFELEVEDELSVAGFYEDGEFKAGTVENLTTGETIVLRDEAGHPMWAGQGRFEGQDMVIDLLGQRAGE